ncbi:MAG: ABC transporter ATP-binding protein [Planctomycetes bacterium]|nr:ABC transporter ATP-binding protein [Planctomycetota bacterium]
MLELRDLRKSFGSTLAVDGLTLSVRTGEVLGLLGPNGAGKTTTIGMAIGLVTPDSGTVSLANRGSPADPALRHHLGVAPQALALYDDLSAEENLSFFAGLYSMPADLRRARVSATLDLVGLTPRRDDRVQGFSGGMKRRLNLAAALLHEPPLLLLDEPTAGVDPQSRNSILDLVRELKSRGTTIVYTTHYMEEAQRLCDRVAIMDKGRLLALDSVDRLISAHGGHSVVTSITASGESRVQTADPVKEIAAILARGDVQAVQEVRIERPDLESVFLNLTGRSLRD